MTKTISTRLGLTAVLLGSFMLLSSTVFAATTLFTDNFDQSGSGIGTNNWTNFSGATDGSRVATSDDGLTVGVSSKGVLLEAGAGADPDDAAQHEFATEGFSTLHVSYSRVISSFEVGDSFVAQYSLDDGAFVNFETLTTDQAHAAVTWDIPNPDRHTKLTVRFFVNGNADNDEVGIDNFELTGEGAPLFYDGFESNDFSAPPYGAWTQEETPGVIQSASNSWTNDNTTANGHSGNVDGASTPDPDDAFYRTVDTTGNENIVLRYSRKVDNLSPGESLKVFYSTDGVPTWTEIDSTENVPFASVSFALPAAADNNPNLQIRFEVNGSGTGDDAYVDDVVVWGDLITTATLTLEKDVTNDNGGTEADTAWTLSASGPTPISGVEGSAAVTSATVDAGTYTLSESGPSGYSASDWSCVGATVSGGNQITLAGGDSVTCTITNDDIAPTLTVVKEVVNDNGGTKVVADFPLFIDATSVASGATTTLTSNIEYTVSETSQDGYTGTIGGDCAANGTITLTPGQVATCTITNDDNPATLTLVKVLPNDNGGTATSADFNVYIDAAPASWGANSVNAGSYTVSEDTLAGYTASVWGEDCAPDGTVTLGIGESKTCTITNDDDEPSLTLKKTVVGGSAAASDFTLTATGPTGFSGSGPSVSNGASFDAGTYDLSESGPAGYTGSAWVCAGTGTQDDDDTVTLDPGETLTCTITNTRDQGTIELLKEFIGTPEDVTIAIGTTQGGSEVDSADLSGDGTTGENTVDTGTFFVSETLTNPANYTTGLACYNDVDHNNSVNGGDTFHAVNTSTGEVSVSANDDVICTFSNTRKQGTLTIAKVLPNDNGGTANSEDFSFSINGGAPIPFEADGSNTLTLDTGTYSVVETNPATGYTLSYSNNLNDDANCTDLTVVEGGERICTITNDDEPGTLIVIKHVVNDNGGTAVASDFTIDSGGTNDTPDDFAGEESPGTTVTLGAGAYNVTETGPGGYAQSASADCSGTIANGEIKTCTITNDDESGVLIVRKVLINDNGGTSAITTFKFRVNGGTLRAFEADGQNDIAVDAGTYTIIENAASGYVTSYSNSKNANTDCASLPVGIGETVTCTITNDDIAPPPANACATPLIAPAGYTLQNGTPGTDVVTLAPYTMFVGNGGNDTVTSSKNGNYIVCTLGGNDVVRLSGTGAHTIDAGNGKNNVTTGNRTGFVTTGTGIDSITVGNGAETINAGDGNNTITTGSGNQTITTGSGDDVVTTNGGSDTINVGAGNNKVFSRAGNDSLTALGGNDFFDAGAGADTCNAGGGVNTVLNCAP